MPWKNNVFDSTNSFAEALATNEDDVAVLAEGEVNSRLMTPVDRPFVANTWARAMQFRMPTRNRFNLVDKMLLNAVVRCFVTQEKTGHGWAAKHGESLAFVYIPPDLRRKGFAKQLIAELWPEGGPKVALHPLPRWPRFLPGCEYVHDALIEVMAA